MLSECNKSLSRPRDVGTWWRSSYTIFGLIRGVPRRAVERLSERAGERPTFPTAPRRPPTHKTCGEAGGRRPGSSPPPPTSPPVRSSYCTAVAAFSSGIVGGGDGDETHPEGRVHRARSTSSPSPCVVSFVAVNAVVLVVAVAVAVVIVVVVSEPARAILSPSPAREVGRRRPPSLRTFCTRS